MNSAIKTENITKSYGTSQALKGINLEIGEIDTVGGAVFNIFGRIPKEGDSVEWSNFKLTVEKMKRRRIQSVRIEKMGQNEAS